jgi:hypothetical protein
MRGFHDQLRQGPSSLFTLLGYSSISIAYVIIWTWWRGWWCLELNAVAQVDHEDILVSFDVVSLFTMVPIGEALYLLSWHFDEDIFKLFCHVLTSSIFRFNNQFCEQTNGVAMGLPLFPVIANFFMEHFEETALKGVTTSPSAGFTMWMTCSSSCPMVQASCQSSLTT